MTRRTGNLDLLPSDWLEVHPDDAAPFLLSAGWTVVDAADPAGLATRYVKDGRPLAPSFHVQWARLTP